MIFPSDVIILLTNGIQKDKVMEQRTDPNKKWITVQVDTKLFDALTKYSNDQDRNVSSQVRFFITEALKKINYI
jgi:hypothetical protein